MKYQNLSLLIFVLVGVSVHFVWGSSNKIHIGNSDKQNIKHDFNALIEDQIRDEKAAYHRINESNNRENPSLKDSASDPTDPSESPSHLDRKIIHKTPGSLKWNEYADIKVIPSEQVVVEESQLISKDKYAKKALKAQRKLFQKKQERMASEVLENAN